MSLAPAEAAAEVSDAQEARPAVSIVVPAYNEAQAVADALRGLLQTLAVAPWSHEVIVVDDGSADETAAEASSVDGVRVLSHPQNRGYGAALKTGIRAARGDIIVITDSDGTYPPEHITELVDALSDCDMAVGARIGEVNKIPLIRRPAKWFLNRLASFLAEAHIPDLNSGLRAFRREHVIPFFGILPSGFSFTTTITLAMLCNDYRVRYLPINYEERVGRSKIKPLQDTYKFLLLVLRTVCYFNPLKVFVPVSFILILLGLIRLTYNVCTIEKVAEAELLCIVSGIQIGAFGLLADAVAKARLMPRQ